MNPFAGPIAQFLACSVPVLLAMTGALVLGVAAGWLMRPVREVVPPEVAAEAIDLDVKRKAAEEKIAAMRAAMDELRQKIGEERGQRDQLSTRQQQEVQSLRQALVAAQRKSPQPPGGPSTVVEKVVPDPAHLARIAHLERETARIPGLLKEIAELKKPARPAGGPVPKPLKKAAPAKAATQAQPLPEQVYRLMSTSFGRKIQPDDLQLVEGIGPKIKQQLVKNGLKTWADVAAAKPAQLKKVLEKGGERFQLHDPTTWPEQARMMTENRWEELRKYQRKLTKAK